MNKSLIVVKELEAEFVTTIYKLGTSREVTLKLNSSGLQIIESVNCEKFDNLVFYKK